MAKHKYEDFEEPSLTPQKAGVSSRTDDMIEEPSELRQDEQTQKTDRSIAQNTNLGKRGRLSGVPLHGHNGKDLEKIPLRDIGGLFEVVTVAPAGVPKNCWEQIKIFDNAGTPELHVYDYIAQTWRVFT